LCFSPDGKRLYVADSGAPKHIRAFDVGSGGRLENSRVFAKIDKGAPDGIRCDTEGRLWSSAGDGVHVFAPTGELLGKILVPEAPANLAFGGPDMKTLFITARKSLYCIEVNAKGIR
ncbi:MAG: SMP-30/gluconolactonase/LRE family protein, partial [Verrucomicrobia bacterium]|nr:SMP-30/gluconolactonase/LRE family protein [Verrucomicrobiota bacterium]